MIVNIPPCNADIVRRISERYSLPLLLATILQRRGVKEKDMLYYLEDEFVYQESPFLVDDIYTAIERIDEAIESDEKILIFENFVTPVIKQNLIFALEAFNTE